MILIAVENQVQGNYVSKKRMSKSKIFDPSAIKITWQIYVAHHPGSFPASITWIEDKHLPFTSKCQTLGSLAFRNSVLYSNTTLDLKSQIFSSNTMELLLCDSPFCPL